MSRFSRLAEAFDAYAVDFDDTVGDSEVVRSLRRRVYERVRHRCAPGGRILDINCGTGTDCVMLSGMGYETTGIDISPAMIDRARAKAADSSQFKVLPFERASELGEGVFDLVLSNNSGLNCAMELRPVFEQVHRVLRPGGWLLIVVMPPFSLWEMVAGLARFDVTYAFRRRRVTTADIKGYHVPLQYWGVQAIRSSASQLFELASVRGLNVMSPSPNSHQFSRRTPGLSRILGWMDRAIGRLPGLRRWGDQILVELRRRDRG
jgi:SAM-dependent methyltransferase